MVMVFEFFVWWYGRGWLEALRRAQGWVTNVQMEFSAGVLLKTLFAPWKRIISPGGRSIDEKFRAAVDNLISRVIGFFVRLLTLLVAIILIILAAAAGILFVVAWPLIPLATVYVFYRSLKG